MLAAFASVSFLGDSMTRQIFVAMLDILTNDNVNGHCKPNADERARACRGAKGYDNDVNIAFHVREVADAGLCPGLPPAVRASLEMGWRATLRPLADKHDLLPFYQWTDDMIQPRFLSAAAHDYLQSVPPPERSAAARRARLTAEYEAAVRSGDRAAHARILAHGADLVTAARRAHMVEGLHRSVPGRLLQLLSQQQGWPARLKQEQRLLIELRNSTAPLPDPTPPQPTYVLDGPRDMREAIFTQATRVRLLEQLVREVELGKAAPPAERPPPPPPPAPICLRRSLQVVLLGACMHYGKPLRQNITTLTDVGNAYAHVGAVLDGVHARSRPYGGLRHLYMRLHQYNVEAMRETNVEYADENEHIIPTIDEAIAAKLTALSAENTGGVPPWEFIDFRQLTGSAPRQASWDGVHWKPFINHRKAQLFINYLHAVLEEEGAAVAC